MKRLVETLRTALSSEFKTDAGRINAIMLVGFTVLVLAGGLQQFVETVIRIWRPDAVAPPASLTTVLLMFLLSGGVCVGLLVFHDLYKDRDGGDLHMDRDGGWS